MGTSGSQNGGTVPYKPRFCGDIPLHRPYIGLIYGRYLQLRFLKWPLIFERVRCAIAEIWIICIEKPDWRGSSYQVGPLVLRLAISS